MAAQESKNNKPVDDDQDIISIPYSLPKKIDFSTASANDIIDYINKSPLSDEIKKSLIKRFTGDSDTAKPE